MHIIRNTSGNRRLAASTAGNYPRTAEQSRHRLTQQKNERQN